jgi:hypothetical protein
MRPGIDRPRVGGEVERVAWFMFSLDRPPDIRGTPSFAGSDRVVEMCRRGPRLSVAFICASPVDRKPRACRRL